METSLQLFIWAATPKNLAVLLPCEVPKPLPVIVTGVPVVFAFAETFEMTGAAKEPIAVNRTKKMRTDIIAARHWEHIVFPPCWIKEPRNAIWPL
jgi:hypothetical protein